MLKVEHPRFSRIFCSVWAFLLVGFSPVVSTLDADDDLESFVEWLLEDGSRLEGVRFADVVEAVSDVEVLPVDASSAVDAALLKVIGEKADALLQVLSDPAHPVHEAGRINETSRFIESFLRAEIDGVEGLTCTTPLNAQGNAQLSGYPDLRIEHLASGRVFYLDPKVYRKGSEQSSFRTFYFEPKGETNKILDDASHLILGVAHSGKSDLGLWRFDSWQLIDLAEFKVRLKAEFQASNRDLYREEAVLLRSDGAPAPAGEAE